MSEEIIHIPTISKLHEALGFGGPKHPLVSILKPEDLCLEQYSGVKYTAGYYSIFLKDKSCGLQYGRNYYDFEGGVLSFIGPNQVVSTQGDNRDATGWMLFFHPELFRKSSLANNIDDYHFFSYDVYEALHLSEKEEKILEECVRNIEFELEQNIDAHSQPLLVSNIELLLNYCNRFYERQFNTRTNVNKDIVSQVKKLIKDYYETDLQIEQGPITTTWLADKVILSKNYLGDLLKKETGKNTKEHINDFLVSKAKSKLLTSSKNINEIAYDLGFNYPHYFSRLFKQKTGLAPNEYREK